MEGGRGFHSAASLCRDLKIDGLSVRTHWSCLERARHLTSMVYRVSRLLNRLAPLNDVDCAVQVCYSVCVLWSFQCQVRHRSAMSQGRLVFSDSSAIFSVVRFAQNHAFRVDFFFKYLFSWFGGEDLLRCMIAYRASAGVGSEFLCIQYDVCVWRDACRVQVFAHFCCCSCTTVRALDTQRLESQILLTKEPRSCWLQSQSSQD